MLKAPLDLNAPARLKRAPLPPETATLLQHAFMQLGLQGEALQAALRNTRLQLSGTEVALSFDAEAKVLIAAAHLTADCLHSTERKSQALRANALLMLHTSVGVAHGLDGHDRSQLIGRLPTAGQQAPGVARWLLGFAGLAGSIGNRQPNHTDPKRPRP